MPLQLVRNDITKMPVDAIVNAANSTLLGGGGVDGAIHRAAGIGLLAECVRLGGCKVGQAKLTGGYKLPCKHVIHTVGPKWTGGTNGEAELLAKCYRNSLSLAREHGCESVAFPLISTGVYHYPILEALRIATDTINAFLQSDTAEDEMLVFLVIYDSKSYAISQELYDDISSYIDERYIELRAPTFSRRADYGDVDADFSAEKPTTAAPLSGLFDRTRFSSAPPPAMSAPATPMPMDMAHPACSLEEAVKQLDESFSEMLLRKIDEKSLTDAACYKKAGIDRKLFSKIRSNPQYKPSKPTAVAFAAALELPLDEARDLISKAGFSLSHSNKFDIIIEYFFERGNYNILEINEALFSFDQTLIGS